MGAKWRGLWLTLTGGSQNAVLEEVAASLGNVLEIQIPSPPPPN